jgi:polysaccharide deacetylase 2 family uncharacterized protein YibQ
VAADDLSAPLGRAPISKRRTLPIAPARLLAGALGLVVAVFIGWAIFVSDPQGGEPSVTVALPQNVAPAGKADAAATPRVADSSAKPDAASPAVKTDGKAQGETPGVITIIDGSSGKRQEVQLPQGETKAGAGAGAGDPRLLETTRHGLIPKIAADGTRPADAYATPRANVDMTDAPRIAIVVTGLGVGVKLTDAAISKLPGAVTFAFVPYGAELEPLAAKAREAGHELLLQVPMEPFDYPDNDPGPQTLLTSLAPEQNIDRLYWVMSRMRGYVGIANYLGARLTATEASFAPVLRETAKRGLVYFDDAASARSVAAQIAGANNIAFARADVTIDAVPTAAEIAKALTRLEGMARSNGVAVGVASALPVTVERIAQWTKTAKGRGFILVPISIAAVRSKPS